MKTKFNIKWAHAILPSIIILFMLLFGNINTNAQTRKATHQTSLATSLSNYDPEYLQGGAIIGEPDPVSNTFRNTYMNNTILKLYYLAYEQYLKPDWASRVYGPNLGEKGYLDGFILSVKDSSLYDYHFIPKEEITESYKTQNLFCYEQILLANTTLVDASEIMISDLFRFFQLKYGTYIKPTNSVILGYFLKRTNQNYMTNKMVRAKLKHLGNREYRSLKDFCKVIDQFYRPTGTEATGLNIPYIFDVDGIDGEREIIMPVWKAGDKLEDFILALNANGLEFTKGQMTLEQIFITDDRSKLGF